MKKTVSIVIPVRNEEEYIANTLDSILEQDYDQEYIEVVVCDGMSTDRTPDIVSKYNNKYPNIRLLNNTGIRSSSGRNCGIENTTAEIVVIIDGHVELKSKTYLSDIVQIFTETGADCLGRAQPLKSVPGSAISEAISIVRASVIGHSKTSYIYSDFEGFVPAESVGVAYLRGVFDMIGYFDESFDACEDLEFNTRVDEYGLKCYISPKLKLSYYARSSLKGFFKQMFRYGYGRYKYLIKHKNKLSFSQLIPFFLVLLTAASLVSLTFSNIFTVLILSLYMTYILAVLSSALYIKSKEKRNTIFNFLIVILFTHYGLGIGFFSSMLKRGRIS